MKYSYEDKAAALRLGLVAKAIKYHSWINSIHPEGELLSGSTRKALISTFEQKAGMPWSLLMSMKTSRYSRKRRIQKRIQKYIQEGKGAFYTLTFRDHVLASTSEDTRRQYVRRWLSLNFKQYVANIDFGDKNEREHYHAVVNLEDGVLPEEWPHGFHKVQFVAFEGVDDTRISKYMSKLTNHALKQSGHLKRIIYSRKITL